MRSVGIRLSTAASHGPSGFGGGVWNRLRHMYNACQLLRDQHDDAATLSKSFVSLTNDTAAPMAPIPTRRIRANPESCPRSALFLPANALPRGTAVNNTRRFPQPDIFVMDLSHGGTSAGREAVLRHLHTPDPARRCLVRVRSPEFDPTNGFLDLELVALLGTRVEGVVLPSVTPNTYALVEPYVHPSHRLWALFDTPRSLTHAAAVCAQGHYHTALTAPTELHTHLYGPNTDGNPMPHGLPRVGNVHGDAAAHQTRDGGRMEEQERAEEEVTRLWNALPLWYSSCQVLLAARAYGMHVLDGPFSDASDTRGFRCDVRRSRLLGFDGRVLIHVAQVRSCHDAFTPTEAEVRWAQTVQPDATYRKRAAQVLERYKDWEIEEKEEEEKKKLKRSSQRGKNTLNEEINDEDEKEK